MCAVARSHLRSVVRPELREQAHKRWRSILPMLGVPKALLNGKNQPCPGCGGKDRFRWTDHEGTGGYFCNGCGAGDGAALLALVHGWDFPTIAKEVRSKLGLSREIERPRMDHEKLAATIKRMWGDAHKIQDHDEAGKYLTGRGFAPPYPKALRFMQNCKYEGGYLPAMLAKVYGPDGVPFTLHRTYLKDGRKAPLDNPRRMMPGDTPLGSYVPLYAPVEGLLCVAEGIETALAVTRNSSKPCWSVISSGGMAAFTPPEGVTKLHIYGDNDENYAGHAAAYRLAHRMAVRKTPLEEISVRFPAEPGTDFADYKSYPG